MSPGLSNAASAEIAITIGMPPVIVTTTSLAAGRAKTPYSSTLMAAGGSGVFTWAVTAGILPAGLTLNTTTGAISGTPKAGVYTVTVTAVDAADPTNAATATYTINIAAAVKVISPRAIPLAAVGVPYSYEVLAANVQGTVKWDLAGGAMPPGMTLGPTTGVISGTCFTAGTWHFNARVKDASTDHTLTLTLKVE